jgi:hypothetical protein
MRDIVKPLIISGADFVADYVAPDYIVDDIIQRGRVMTMTAKTGHGKTAVGINVTFSIAHGVPFGGRATEKGKVLFLAGENPDDVRARFLLCADVYGLAINENMHFLDGIINIEEKLEIIRQEAIDIGDLTAVIVDTAAAYFHGDDENSNTEMIKYAHTLRKLTELSGKPAAIVPCHPVKNASKDNLLPRGGSAFVNEVDGNLSLWSDDNGKTTQLHWFGKLRGPGFEPIDFELKTETSEKVKDKKGRLIPSVAAHPITEDKAKELTKAARSDEDGLLEVMLQYSNGSIRDWARHLDWLAKDSGQPSTSRVHRTIGRLKDDHLVRKYRSKWKLTDQGRKEAENAL